ncbi:hypothetical protein D8Y22_12850 [Salinadaptatus halalkaliphilus]|uniref:Uncharacterized protein n=1 Tax=Salinadaptatus halalkaliphilus TaxID=2419781 RepID=A0A4S3TN78_9EURY|nr:hypothetical protein D8Y22_12850 [Salinadaptatus halalkaliphilus]
MKTELEDGREVEIEITGSPQNKRRIDVEVDGGRRWVFAVQENVAVLVMALNEIGSRIDVDVLPTWIEPTLQRIGLEGVEA